MARSHRQSYEYLGLGQHMVEQGEDRFWDKEDVFVKRPVEPYTVEQVIEDTQWVFNADPRTTAKILKAFDAAGGVLTRATLKAGVKAKSEHIIYDSLAALVDEKRVKVKIEDGIPYYRLQT